MKKLLLAKNPLSLLSSDTRERVKSPSKNIYLTLRSFVVCLFFLISFFAFADIASAATYYWVGGTTNSSTSNPVNWNTSAGACADSVNLTLPSASDTIRFASGCINDATIDSALSVTSFYMDIGYTGTININDIDVISSGALYMSEGILNILNGGTLTSGSTNRIGYGSDSGGAVIISGIGSSWSAGGTVLIARDTGSVGSITIQNGGTMTNSGVYVGYVGEGTVLVDGAGSNLNNTGFSFCGHGGVGMVRVQNGGTYSTVGITMARDIGSSCDFLIEGEDSALINTGGMILGSRGEATVLVSNGAQVNNNSSVNVSMNSATGTLTIDGTDSLWTNSEGFYLGRNLGVGILNLVNGGILNVGNGIGSFFVANEATSSGTINIGSGYTMDLIEAGAFTIGSGIASLPPIATTTITASNVSTNSINWDWDDDSRAIGYKVYRSSDDALLTTISSSTSNWTQESLSPNTPYSIYVRGTNAQGEGLASSDSSDVYTLATTPTSQATTPTSHSSSGGSTQSQVSNLIAMGNYTLAREIAKQYGITIPSNTLPQTTTKPNPTNSVPSSSSFTRDLKIGMKGLDVKLLQQFLNTHGFPVSKKGIGSKGRENTTFGPATKAALVRFQKANKITPAVGYFGSVTRNKVWRVRQ